MEKSVRTPTKLPGANSSSAQLAPTSSPVWTRLQPGRCERSPLTLLGIGSVRDEAWAVLKNLKKGSKDIVELAGEAENLAKRLHPRDEEAAERHAVDVFLGALDRTLAAEVQKLGHRTMEDIAAATRQIEKILEEQTDYKMERLISTMQDQLRTLNKDLKEENEAVATHKAAAPTAAAMAAIPAPALTVAAAAQAPPTAPTCNVNHGYGGEVNFLRLPRRQIGCRPPRCFLCDEEGHVAANCPVRPILQRLLRQQARASTHNLPQGPTRKPPTTKDDSHPGPKMQLNLLEGSTEAQVTPVGCAVGPPITGQLNLEGIPVLGLVDTGASVTCMGFSVWWQYREAFRGDRPRRTQQTAPNSRENPTPQPTMGRSQRESELHCNHRSRVAPCADWNGHYASTSCPY